MSDHNSSVSTPCSGELKIDQNRGNDLNFVLGRVKVLAYATLSYRNHYAYQIVSTGDGKIFRTSTKCSKKRSKETDSITTEGSMVLCTALNSIATNRHAKFQVDRK